MPEQLDCCNEGMEWVLHYKGYFQYFLPGFDQYDHPTHIEGMTAVRYCPFCGKKIDK